MIFTPPQNIATRDFTKKSVFLAGSIEMGKAEKWQSHESRLLRDKGLNVFNPRRSDWDSTWSQDFTNPNFSQQVNWELDALDTADYIIFYFQPGTVSLIRLLELGIHIARSKCLVCCPDGFQRKGNVDIICARYNVPIFEDMLDLNRHLLNIID